MSNGERSPLALYTPPLRQVAVFCAVLIIWLTITGLCIGFRPEHFAMAALLAALFMAWDGTRRLMVALLPFVVFGVSYDWMNLLPNYEVNPVDIEGLYLTEKALFGINTAEGLLTPNEWFALHTTPIINLLAGVFYLCWVPLPVCFGLWLYAKGRKPLYLHFAIAFLIVNLLGFAGYYLHPAAPPWYMASCGTEFVAGTHGQVAGLGSFDAMTGCGIFHGLYARNANVFAAMPSLHSAYTFVAFIYAVRGRVTTPWIITLGIVTLGIWFTAVYTSHHYILDVLGGIACSLAGVLLFEGVMMHLKPFQRFMDRYICYIRK